MRSSIFLSIFILGPSLLTDRMARPAMGMDLHQEGVKLNKERDRIEAETTRIEKDIHDLMAEEKQLNEQHDLLAQEAERILKNSRESTAAKKQLKENLDNLKAFIASEEQAINADVNQVNEMVNEFNRHSTLWNEQFKIIHRDVPARRADVKRYLDHYTKTGELIEDTAPFWATVVYPRSPNHNVSPDQWKTEAVWYNSMYRDMLKSKQALKERKEKCQISSDARTAELVEESKVITSNYETIQSESKALLKKGNAYRAARKSFQSRLADWKQQSDARHRAYQEWTKEYNRYLAKVQDSKPVPAAAPERIAISGELLDEASKLIPLEMPSYNLSERLVFAWLANHSDQIVAAGSRWGVDPKAIAGVIAWEALLNVQPKGGRADGFTRWAGVGKVHYKDYIMSHADGLTLPVPFTRSKTSAQMVEEHNLLPRRSENERAEHLKSVEGSLEYIGAIMKYSTQVMKTNAGRDISNDAGVLAFYYNARTVEEVDARSKTLKPGEILDVSKNDMASWIVANLKAIGKSIGHP